MIDTTQKERETAERNESESKSESESEEETAAIDTCPECDGRLEDDHQHGERACTECGLIVDEDEIDHSPEWRAFNSAERDQKSRVGSPTTKMMHDKGLSTNIGWQDTDAYGNTLSSRQRKKMSRLRTWDDRFRTRDPKERNLKHALGEIDRMASALGLPKTVRETASVIYRRALEDGLLPGRSIEGVATASVYTAARQAGTPRSLDEVVGVSRIKKLQIMRTYRYVARELGLEVAPADPREYLPRFASDLNISDEAERQSRELLDIAINEGYNSGKSPTGLAAAALYAGTMLVNEKVTQATVSEVSDVSEVTIRNRYKELIKLTEDFRTP